MKHSNISIFVPHIGCPHLCSFCDQHTISGAENAPTGEDVRRICAKALSEVKTPENTEIAFFGGSFTAIPRDYMLELLTAAHEFVGEGKFHGIRCSTRPDCIDREVLELLKEYGVTAIELGAQSMKNRVLEANERGHTVQDVHRACALIKEYGFELGLQMMVGLYKSTAFDEVETMQKIGRIRPDTVRIYPVVILKGTRLAELYQSGEYSLMPFDKVVELCGSMLEEFHIKKIRVIKCGLHASEFVERDMVGGYYHPAFRELCESVIYRRGIEYCIKHERERLSFHKQSMKCRFERFVKGENYTVAVEPSCISKAAGHKKSNINFFKQQGININIIGDDRVPVYQCELRR